ncbi:helix-turn-helix domain-containing protein [Streptomyces sp. SAS_281]|uniref:helix-turn-helix domain-containing protein n=1 Tax=Streptomyces sp. SAS_281 TaxID=3412744 RepID=UPI00403D488E
MRTARTADETKVSQRVGQNIKRIRTARGLSGRALAELVQGTGHRLHHTSLNTIEAGANSKGGQRAVTVDDLVAISAALGMRPEQLLAEPECAVCLGFPPAGFACTACGTTTPRA